MADYIIFSAQEYKDANHKELWRCIAEQNLDNNVYVINIPADLVVSVLKKKIYRIKESRLGIQRIEENMYVCRPLFFLRPEVVPTFFDKLLAKRLWKYLKKSGVVKAGKSYNLICYDAKWVRIIKSYIPQDFDIKIAYYLFDEVRYNATSGQINKNRYLADEYACKSSDIIFTMSDVLKQSRLEYNSNIITLGNGAMEITGDYYEREEKSIGFVGNIRDWIDKDLLKKIIEKMPNWKFYFVGNIEENMKSFVSEILSLYDNVFYEGRMEREEARKVYQRFTCVIIPYKQDAFTAATRPIKIVESVMAGTPVVTIPVNGYQENEFIRFATTEFEFKNVILEYEKSGIDRNSEIYRKFMIDNSWKKKANIVYEAFKALC